MLRFNLPSKAAIFFWAALCLLAPQAGAAPSKTPEEPPLVAHELKGLEKAREILTAPASSDNFLRCLSGPSPAEGAALLRDVREENKKLAEEYRRSAQEFENVVRAPVPALAADACQGSVFTITVAYLGKVKAISDISKKLSETRRKVHSLGLLFQDMSHQNYSSPANCDIGQYRRSMAELAKAHETATQEIKGVMDRMEMTQAGYNSVLDRLSHCE